MPPRNNVFWLSALENQAFEAVLPAAPSTSVPSGCPIIGPLALLRLRGLSPILYTNLKVGEQCLLKSDAQRAVS
jgi:hypothetical protein